MDASISFKTVCRRSISIFLSAPVLMLGSLPFETAATGFFMGLEGALFAFVVTC